VARATRARASRDPKRGRLQHKASLLRKLEAAWRRQYEGRAKGHEVHDTMQAFLNAGGTKQEMHAAMNRATKATEKRREGSYRRGR